MLADVFVQRFAEMRPLELTRIGQLDHLSVHLVKRNRLASSSTFVFRVFRASIVRVSVLPFDSEVRTAQAALERLSVRKVFRAPAGLGSSLLPYAFSGGQEQLFGDYRLVGADEHVTSCRVLELFLIEGPWGMASTWLSDTV